MANIPEIEAFYTTWTWLKCRTAFAKSKGNLCEKCLSRGIINPGSKDRPLEVHHRTPITMDNLHDPNITLNWSNLQLLCKSCHDEERETKPKRWRVDENGKVQLREGPPSKKSADKRPQGCG